MDHLASRRRLFEVNNARTQSVEEVVQTFVPSESFWRLLSVKNHIVLGSRGSGKTAAIRMLAHDHLARFDDDRARQIVKDRALIGVYVPMRAEWVSTIKNKPWQTEAEKEAWFQWRLNISTCAAFIDTIDSCLKEYVSEEPARLLAEKRLAQRISEDWSGGAVESTSLLQLRSYLEDVEWSKQMFVAATAGRKSSDGHPRPGLAFEAELFGPLRRAIVQLRRAIEFPTSTAWAVCLDEIEFLDKTHHRILNSHLRSSSGNLCFKLTTMPYFHHTLATNTAAPLSHGNDFEYVYLDYDPSTRGTDRQGWLKWGEDVLDRRIRYSTGAGQPLRLANYLGEQSPLLDDKAADWSIDSPMMRLLREHTSTQTYKRATRLAGDSAFNDQISRKLHGALLLRETVKKTTGNAQHDLYSGPKMAILCSDANPRQLIRLFNALVLQNPSPISRGKKGIGGQYRPSPQQQTRILIDYSREVLSFAAAEEEIGESLFQFVQKLGQYFYNRFHNQPLGTDYFYAIRVDETISESDWNLIRYAVALGLLFPKVGFSKPELLPYKSGEFNLAYRLAPAFSLLPRRGKAVPLRMIQQASTTSQLSLHWSPDQYPLPTIASQAE
jgi:hypothetical protein